MLGYLPPANSTREVEAQASIRIDARRWRLISRISVDSAVTLWKSGNAERLSSEIIESWTKFYSNVQDRHDGKGFAHPVVVGYIVCALYEAQANALVKLDNEIARLPRPTPRSRAILGLQSSNAEDLSSAAELVPLFSLCSAANEVARGRRREGLEVEASTDQSQLMADAIEVVLRKFEGKENLQLRDYAAGLTDSTRLALHSIDNSTLATLASRCQTAATQAIGVLDK